MSTFRKKSSSSTDETSSSSSTGSSSSGSSSGSDSGSSSSDSDSSTVEEKNVINQQKATSESQPKSQVTTRRKSSEVKSASSFKSVATAEKVVPFQGTSKLRSTNLSQKLSRNQEFSSDDEVPPVKKNTKLPHNAGANTIANPRKKGNSTATQQHSSQNVAHGEGGSVAGGGGKAPPAIVKQHHQKNFSAAVKANTNKTNTAQNQTSVSTNPFKLDESTIKDNIYPHFSTVVSSDNTDNEFPNNEKLDKKAVLKPIEVKQHTSASISSNRVRTTASKGHPKRSVSTKSISATAPAIVKSSEESESESGTSSGEGSTSTSGSDHSESSNSSASQTPKKTSKPKRNLELTSEDKDDKQQETKGRKLTRSLSTRRSKNYLIRGGDAGGAAGSETDSDVDASDVFAKFSKSPTKKNHNTVATSKATTKKESIPNTKNRSQSPQPAMEKKCPIEGCDSSGHLSGNQDRHFLSEACPIYHNMSASECKERANERKQREEFRQKTGNVGGVQQEHSTRKSLTAEQKEFLSKIRESRMRFRPTAACSSSINTEKIKIEKDCPDDDREPSLSGLVPDYDLQLFREAQAIASEKIEEELKDLPVGKGIRYITMGKYKMKVWYQSPYPDDAARLPKMYICEFCLRYQKSETGIKRHAQKCVWRHPPGDEIYRKGKLQVWQVDGKRHKQYCQHLCLLAKFFLDHKTLYYDVEPFLFYIMTLADIDGCHTVGYFSKEKNSFYNVSCILTLPPYQRKGYGRLLIDFSYLLTRVEGKIGSPEKPLSDLGLISYRSYWKDVLLDYLCSRTGSTLSIKDVSQEMAIYSYDIVSTLQALGMMKYWKGKHIVLKKQDVLDEYDERVKRRGNFPKIDDSCLRWSPFVPPQTNVSP